MKMFFLLVISFICLIGCSKNPKNLSNTSPNNYEQALDYDFNSSKNKWKLPMELDEISGLAYYAKNQLACINDEEGKVFIYNLKKKKIIRTIVFGKDGDYEGLTYQKPFFYIVKNNGQLSIYNEETDETKKINLPFNSKNNIEGLCLENKQNLLLTMKGESGFHGEETSFKGVYRYNIVNYKTELAYKTQKKKKLGFTGIAVHQTSGKVLILSHRSKEIYQVDQSTQKVDYVWPVSRKLFTQPEGICFSPDGKLFISNERADKEYATILEF